MKRRKVDEKLRTLESRHKRLQDRLQETEQVCGSPQKRVIAVRHAGRNRGMTPEFEAHARNMMATGGKTI